MYVEVLMEIKSKNVDRTFTYALPQEYIGKVFKGSRVRVFFGKQIVEGYVLNITNNTSLKDVKEIVDLIDQEPVLNSEMLELGKYLKEITLSSLSSCYSAMLPKALKAKNGTNISSKKEKYIDLVVPLNDAIDQCKNDLQKQILFLFTKESHLLKKKVSTISPSALKSLLRYGILKETEEEIYRYQIKKQEQSEKKQLNQDQQRAVEIISSGFNHHYIYLLHGVTGSGKTEVYLELIENVLKQKKTALILVPEISLTPQLVTRFSHRFQKRIALLHSALNDGEKYDEWRKIIRGEVDIVIGVRSAIFAPLKNLGIIILDEEHSESYKQDCAPRYHTRDIAIERGKNHSCPVILGSATPCLYSMARAQKGVYQYINLAKRANNSNLPTCKIIDMKEEIKMRHPIISRELECKIIEKLNKKEQVLLLLNRRGHSTIITCSNCGYTYRCPYCDITLTYHKSSNSMRCHYCGFTKFKEEKCPNCHEDGLNYLGLGTEKLEDYLINIFPTAKIIRMDRDTTLKKGSYEKIIEDFQNEKYDIMLGTQMISKGLDFPKVSLVGIINADATLNIPDFKSNENTFNLLYQASGRAGRSDTTGEVILQTYYPDNFVFTCIKENNYLKFYKNEMKIRKSLKYPPFYYIVVIVVKGKDYEVVSKEAIKVKIFLEKHLDSSSIVLGPTTANVFLVNRIYHFEILIKYRFDSNLKKVLTELDERYLMNSNVHVDIDFMN